MDLLVGSTGFVGSNLAAAHPFGASFHSTDIEQAYGLRPDLCVYAGVRAEKYLALKDPQADLAGIHAAIRNIERIAPKRLVLISTIDVYPEPYRVDETTVIRPGTHPYGADRFLLEQWVKEHLREYLIVRLPGLFGAKLKKNFLYDLIRVVPGMLSAEKFAELSARSALLKSSYAPLPNGFYRLTAPESTIAELKREFESLGFTALNFTDSRSVFQFYNLACLWDHIRRALEQNIPLLNLAVEPLPAGEIFRAVRGRSFRNELDAKPLFYDARSVYAERLGGRNGYLFDRNRVLREIVSFVRSEEERIGS